MAHISCAPRSTALRPDLLIILALTALLSFAAGHNWPEAAPVAAQTAEDWHGNVKRSTWPD
ncbi:hypothetical protein [Ruegeria lacuscaerulensis]|uniref:hypothetical protein n=1 Tax=Ruegeria lacuscaerulensis TaxID=55218 RepID=UPI00148050FE|nr:hypothetical protein [Ruegeria lacuscaerulensis]